MCKINFTTLSGSKSVSVLTCPVIFIAFFVAIFLTTHERIHDNYCIPTLPSNDNLATALLNSY